MAANNKRTSRRDSKEDSPSGSAGEGIDDTEVQRIIDAAGVMAECFKRLERRKALPSSKYNAIVSAANTFRFFESIELSRLRAEFDPEYKKEIEKMNRIAKTGR